MKRSGRFALAYLQRFFVQTYKRQIVLMLLCIGFVGVSKIGQGAYDIGQVYRIVERPEVGQNLVRIVPSKGLRLRTVEFVAPEADQRSLEFFFPITEEQFWSILFSEGRVVIRNVDNGLFTVLDDFEGQSGEYRFEIGIGFVTLFHQSQQLALLANAATPLYMRRGPRMRYDLEHTAFPSSMKFTFVGIRDPQRTITCRPSAILPWLIIIALGIALYTVLFALPATVLSLFAAPRKVLVTQATIFILLLASPAFFGIYVTTTIFHWPGQEEIIGPEPVENDNPGQTRLLLLGGSAAQGQPTPDWSMSVLLNKIAEEQKRAVHTINLSRSAWYLELWLPYAVSAATTHRADAVLMYANFNTFSFQTFRGPLPLLYMLMFYRIVDKLPADWLFDRTRAEQIAEQYVKLRDDLRAHGVQLAVIDDPVFSSYVYYETYLDFHRRLLKALAAKDVHVVPLFADFIAPEYEYYFNDTCHLTPSGYTRAAQLTWDYLTALHIIETE